MKANLKKEIELKDGVTAQLNGTILKIKSQKYEVERNFVHPKVVLAIAGNKIVLSANKATKREKTIVGSFAAHIKNMIKGVKEPFEYKLKICSGHFPMNVSVSGNEIIIKNFFGEAVPRRVKLLEGAIVKISGSEIVVTSPNKEIAGQVAAQIETLCRVTERDRRIFQDGCFITQKGGKEA